MARKSTPAPAGRIVDNAARPTRKGFSVQVAAAAVANGWAVKSIPASDPRNVHIYVKGSELPGLVLTHPKGAELHISLFPDKSGSSDRLDACYLWFPGAGQGRRVQTCYQVLSTIGNGGSAVAASDPARQRPQASVQAAAAVVAPAKVVRSTGGKRKAS